MENSNSLKVTVVSFESLGSSGGFNWFFNKESAENFYESEKKEALSFDNYQICLSEYDTNLPYVDWTTLSQNDLQKLQNGITSMIDDEYMSFFDSCIKQFPHTQAEWKSKVAKLYK